MVESQLVHSLSVDLPVPNYPNKFLSLLQISLRCSIEIHKRIAMFAIELHSRLCTFLCLVNALAPFTEVKTFLTIGAKLGNFIPNSMLLELNINIDKRST